MEEVMNGILIREVETKNIMTKSSLPVGGYSVNPYVGCTHACKYCYASFMKRFTGHKEEWGTFLDVKHWPEIKNPKKYVGQRVVIGSVTDGYNPQEEQFGNTRKLLEQLIGSDAYSNLFSVIIRHLSVPLFHIDSVILIHTILYVNPLTFSVHSQSRYCSHDVTSNPVSAINSLTINNTICMSFCQGDSNKSQHTSIKNQQNPTVSFVKTTETQAFHFHT